MFLVGLVSLVHLALADEASIKIKQVNLDLQRAVVDFTGPLNQGSVLVGTFGEGNQCSFTVTVVKDSTANIDISSCAKAADLKMGQVLERSLILEEKLAAPRTEIPRDDQVKNAKVNANVESRELSEISLLPMQGQSIIQMQYDNSKAYTSVKTTSGGQNYAKDSQSSSSLSAIAGIGLTDNFMIGVRVEQENDDLETKYGPASSSNGQVEYYDFSGWKDPIAGLKYRFLEKSADQMTMDLAVSYSPIGNRGKLATTQTQGNEKRGGEYSQFQLSLSKGAANMEFDLTVGLQINGSAAKYNPDTDEKVSIKASQDLFTDLTGQIRVNELFWVRGHLQIVNYGKSTIGYSSGDREIEGYKKSWLGGSVLLSSNPKKFVTMISFLKAIETDIGVRQSSTDFIATTSGNSTSVTVFYQF